MKRFILILILLLGFKNYSQNSSIEKRGIILSKVDSTSLPSVNIYNDFHKIGTVSNEQGRFLLSIPDTILKKEITISYLGYLTKRVNFNSLKDTIFLIPSTEVLDEISISSNRPKIEEVLDSVYANLKRNYSNKRYLMKAFYRQSVIKDSSYLRMIEADVDIQEYGIKKPLNRDRIKVNSYRRTDNKTSTSFKNIWKAFKLMSPLIKGNRGINQLIWIQKENFINHFSKTKEYNIYHKNILKSYIFDFEKTIYSDKDPIFIFTFYRKSLENIYLEDSQLNRLYINANNYAIIKYERVNGIKRADSFLNFSKTIINYSKIGDYYYMTSVSKYANHKEKGLFIDKLHTYQILSNRKEYDKIKRKESEKKDDDFSEKEYKYDSIFWKNYRILDEVPLNVKLSSANKNSIDNQFKKNATKKE